MELNNISVLTNAHSDSEDLWKMYFKQLDKHFLSRISPIPCYVVSNKNYEHPNQKVIIYDKNESYSKQFLRGLNCIETPFIIPIVDDMVLYGDVNLEKIQYYIEFLGREDYDFIRLIKSGDVTETNVENDLYKIPQNAAYLYSMQVSIWKTESLKNLYKKIDVEKIRKETLFGDACRDLGIHGLYAYNGEDKRGKAHYDSSVFPYVATALRAGKWDFRVYPDIFPSLFEEYKINPHIRGIR